MIRRILVALDGSRNAENVLPYVIPMARASRAVLILTHVLPPDGGSRGVPG